MIDTGRTQHTEPPSDQIRTLIKVADQAVAAQAAVPQRTWRRTRGSSFWKIFAASCTVLVIVDTFGAMHSLLSTLLSKNSSQDTGSLAALITALIVFFLVGIAGRIGLSAQGQGAPYIEGFTRAYRLSLWLLTLAVWVAMGYTVSKVAWPDALAHCLGLCLQALMLAVVAQRIIGLESARHPHLALSVLNLMKSPSGLGLDDRRAVLAMVIWMQQAGWSKLTARRLSELVTVQLQQVEVRFSLLEVLVALVALAAVAVGPLAANGSLGELDRDSSSVTDPSNLIGLDLWQRSVLSTILLLIFVDAALWYSDRKLRRLNVLTLTLAACRQHAWDRDEDSSDNVES